MAFCANTSSSYILYVAVTRYVIAW